MIFNEHSNLKGQHALFSPSQSAWLRYDGEKVADKIISQYRAPLGTEIHEYAEIQIELGMKVTGSVKNLRNSIASFIYSKYKVKDVAFVDYAMKLINVLDYISNDVLEIIKCYINDGIGYKMIPEQILYYSDEIYGTTDTITFRNNFLRIHDLKTGLLPAHMEQLETYMALFCLEYKIKPADIEAELRLYQAPEILVYRPTVEDILPIIEQIISIGKIANEIRREDER